MLLLTRLSVRRANVEVEVLRRTKDHPGDGRRIALPVRKCSANEGKTNRFASFQIRAAFAAIGPRTPLASGMAAREGEDPHAGLQRSRQPGPTGGRPIALSTNPQTQIVGGMCDNCEQHIL